MTQIKDLLSKRDVNKIMIFGKYLPEKRNRYTRQDVLNIINRNRTRLGLTLIKR